MEKPTPGPWYIQDGDIRGDFGIVVESFKAALISDSNARLIAAAPEMYEFLKEIQQEHNFDNLDDYEEKALEARLGAIISKAEGNK